MADRSKPLGAVVDMYCERVGTEFNANGEPFNTYSTLFQLALGLLYIGFVSTRENHDIGLLGGVLFAAVALGAFLWHMLAFNWAYLLDMTLPMFFVVWFTWHWGWRVCRFRRVWPRFAFALVAFGLFGALYGVGPRFPLYKYTSVHWVWWALLLVLSPIHWAISTYRRYAIAIATLILLIAIVFYGWDKAMIVHGTCWQPGTHFLWHLFAATGFFGLLLSLPPEDWESPGLNLEPWLGSALRCA